VNKIVSRAREVKDGRRDVKTARKQFMAAFKAKVALEAVRGTRSVNELAGLQGVHPAQIAAWKKRLVEGAPELLSDGRRKSSGAEGKALTAELHQQIGRLKVELDFLKKKSGLLG
jgi:transposase-like protein